MNAIVRNFAPYFEAYSGDSLSSLSSQSGDKFLTMAFIQTASQGSCTVDWDGDTSTPIASSSFGSDINTVRAGGGDVIPSFGGFAADDTGTEIADSCTNVASIAQQYENVITTYNVTRLDLDTEDNSLTNTAGIDRRNKAIAMVQAWAKANGRPLQISYTIPTTASGLESTGVAILQNAITNHAVVDVVDIMAFDYYDHVTTNMGAAAKSAATGTVAQLHQLYPGKTQAQLWAMMGVTIMPGIDDYPKKTEVTQVADAQSLVSFANATATRMSTLSAWAIQRDNGGCPGNGGANDCSGIAQNTWDFSKAMEPFTGP
jgi:hypothetical protein